MVQYKKIIIRCALTAGIFLAGIGIGVLIMQQHLTVKPESLETGQKLVTDKMAVVNLDEGVMVQDEKVNYAGKLLTDIDDKFIFTGLEDARTGFANGIYAGYMVIPATFSESVVSLNTAPVRAEITYAINNELEEAIKEKVIYEVLGLVSELNNRVSYMYIHSVLDEFHNAQDESDVVMENDLEEKEAINAIKANDLVALVPVTELTRVENNIEPVDISEYMSKNAELTGKVGTKYNEYLMESETDHQKLNEEAKALMTEMGNMDSIMGGVDLAHDGEGNSIYQKGAEELDVLLEENKTALEEKEAELAANICKIYGDIQCYFSEYDKAKAVYEKENEEKYLNTLSELEKLIQSEAGTYTLLSAEEMGQITEVVEQQNQQILQQQDIINSLSGATGEDEADETGEPDTTEEDGGETEAVEIPVFTTYSVPDVGTTGLTELQTKIQKVLENNYYSFSGYQVDDEGKVKTDEAGNALTLKALLGEYDKNLSDETVKAEVLKKQIGEIEKLDISQAVQIIDESIINPIQENVNSFQTAVMNQYAIEKEQLGEYSEAVMDYNPLKYINHEEIQGLTGEMFDNGAELSEAILDTDIQQMEYVADVYEAAANDLNSLQDNIFQAKEESDKAVEEGLAQLQEIKNGNSDENQQIMYDFSQKLPYTRLGSLEYTQAYEFMVNPIGSEKLTENEKNKQKAEQDSVKQARESVSITYRDEESYSNIAIIICAMICVIIVSSTIKYHFHKKEENLEI